MKCGCIFIGAPDNGLCRVCYEDWSMTKGKSETTELTSLVARAMFDRRYDDSPDAAGYWPVWESLYTEMAAEAIAVVRQWDAGK